MNENRYSYDIPVNFAIIIFCTMVLATFFAYNPYIIDPTGNDKSDDELTEDFAKNLGDAIEDSGVQASSNTVTVSDKIPSPVEGVGVSTKP